jgi:LPPG:FO 2-phospho-L-lactate transferase
MTDDLVQTRLTVEVGARTSNFGGLGAGTGPARAEPARAEPPGAPVEIGFQEYFVGLRHSVPIKQARFAGIESSRPAPGVLEAIEEADVIVICPSNPIVSIGPVMAVPGVAAAVAKRRDRTVAVSPIIAGRALKGPADRMLAELGLDPSAAAVAGLWSPWASAFVVDEADAGTAPEVEARGMRCVVARSVMSGPLEAANLAKAVLNAGMGG